MTGIAARFVRPHQILIMPIRLQIYTKFPTLANKSIAITFYIHSVRRLKTCGLKAELFCYDTNSQ